MPIIKKVTSDFWFFFFWLVRYLGSSYACNYLSPVLDDSKVIQTFVLLCNLVFISTRQREAEVKFISQEVFYSFPKKYSTVSLGRKQFVLAKLLFVNLQNRLKYVWHLFPLHGSVAQLNSKSDAVKQNSACVTLEGPIKNWDIKLKSVVRSWFIAYGSWGNIPLTAVFVI